MINLVLLEHARFCANCEVLFSRADSRNGDCPACGSGGTCWLSSLFAQIRTNAVQEAVQPYKPLWVRP
jgi:hypothetical protein